MSDQSIPVECPVDNPYLKGHLLPDVIAGDDLTENGQTVELLPELSGAVEILASVSGNYGEFEAKNDAEPIIKSLGCEACTLAEVCPAPQALRNSIENINGFGALNEIVSAAESGEVLSIIWLEKTKAEVYEEGLTDDQLSFRVMKKVEEQGVSAEKVGDDNVFIVRNGKERNGASKEVAIVDASGDVAGMISEGDRGSRVIAKEVQTLIHQISDKSFESIIRQYKSSVDMKTDDGATIYKTNDLGTGAFRMFFSTTTQGDKVWLVITGVSHHDEQDNMMKHGLPHTINISDFVNSLTDSK